MTALWHDYERQNRRAWSAYRLDPFAASKIDAENAARSRRGGGLSRAEYDLTVTEIRAW